MQTRRNFLSGVAGTLGAPLILGDIKSGKVYRTALIGCGWWGTNILREAVKAGHSSVVAVCDVDQHAMVRVNEELKGWTGSVAKEYEDFREMLEKESPEIVIVGSPDHWHAFHMIAAVRAGAHVYCEKPIGHNIREGQAMVKAARDAGRVVQVGTHRRVSPHNISAMDFLKSGKVGDVGMVRCIIHYGGAEEEPTANEEVPDGLDWDAWCGPAPVRPFNKKMHPKGWRNFLDYANGTIADWGIHWFDQVLWWTEEKAPSKVFSSGGRDVRGEVVNSGGMMTTDAPDHQVATFDFEDFTCIWDNRNFGGNEHPDHNVGAYFYGTKGVLHLGWQDGWTFTPSWKSGEVIHEKAQLNAPDSQNIRELWSDFLDAIKTNRRPVCDIEIAHRSTNMSLLAMNSMKLGRSIEWDGEKEISPGDDEANALLGRVYRGGWKL
ncbi:MAG: Gfo/Idh/MocA family protein [Verrucomicrobiaceae bacterium]